MRAETEFRQKGGAEELKCHQSTLTAQRRPGFVWL